MELWSLLSITAPGLFASPTRFEQLYRTPIEKGKNAELLARLRRRVRPLMLRRTKEQVLDDLPAKQKQVIELLRQASLDVALVDPAHTNVPSTKLDALMELLTEIVGEGHRTLVFSQFTRFLGSARRRLDADGIDYCYLDGSTRNRAAVLEEFTAGSAPVFLTKKVMVYRLVAKDTIEDKVMALKASKAALFGSVMNSDELSSGVLTAADIRDMLD